MQNIKINKQEQIEAVKFVRDTSLLYNDLLKERKDTWLDIYKAITRFKEDRKADWQTTFKVNKAHEIVNKILPRIMAKNPKWIVSTRTDEFFDEDKALTPEQRAEKIKQYEQFSRGIQDYLTYIFDRYSQREPLRLWAKNMIIYGNSYAKIKFKYEVMTKIDDETEEEIGENGEKTIKKVKKYKEEVVWEYPTIEVKSWTNMLYDPRYTIMEDMPWLIDITDNVRLSQLKKKKNKYINLDKLEKIPNMEDYANDMEWYKRSLQQISGINGSELTAPIDKNKLTLKEYNGYYEHNGEEKLYKIITVSDIICICFQEISMIPYEDIKCFEGTETHFATGFVEPILSLQDELNFKKNSASEYVNTALNRSWVRSPSSWVDPRDLTSKPGNIIVTSKDANTALANLQELPMRQLSADFFQEQNDFERQIQSMTFTVDTSNSRNEQALTNTATGIRVKFFETNSVLDEIRKHFEEWMEKLAYKLLQATYDNMEDNIVIKKMDGEWFWELNKELMRDALKRYDIKVEANSSSYDTIEQRREDAIAMYNILQQAAQNGVPVDLEAGLREVLSTFEKKDIDKFFQKQNIMQQVMPQVGGWWLPELWMAAPTSAEATTQAVAWGSLTSAVQ